MKNLMKNRSLAILTSVLSVVTCFASLPQTQAAPDALPPPSPDGCYTGFTTAEGCNALKLLTSGAGNTGLGWHSLSEHQRQLQHRWWRWDTDSQQWGFQYGHWRCSA